MQLTRPLNSLENRVKYSHSDGAMKLQKQVRIMLVTSAPKVLFNTIPAMERPESRKDSESMETSYPAMVRISRSIAMTQKRS